MIYYPDEPSKIESWVSLEEHVKNPVNFPVGIKSGFLVVFVPPKGYEDKYPWKPQEGVLFLGEIPGMKGHGIFASQHGKIDWGYHLDNFYVIPRDELWDEL